MGMVESRADGSMRDVVRAALAPDWSLDAALAAVEPRDLAAAVPRYQASLRPLDTLGLPRAPAKKGDDWFPTEFGVAREAIKPIGMKINPTMSIEQCSTWLSAVVLALSDFPAWAIKEAALRAIRKPMSFLNEVDGEVRRHADEIVTRHRIALARLRQMQSEIERAANPQPALTARANIDRCTPQEIREMAPSMRRVGLSAGFLTQGEVDDALSAEGDRIAPPRPVRDAREPTAADYVAQGMADADAVEAVAERTRILRRSAARPVGGVAARAAAEIITSAAA